MRSIPYGYAVQNGRVVVCEEEAEQIRTAFHLYTEGISLAKISKDTGIGKTHTGIMNILKDEKYKGSAVYPQIVSEKLFEEAGIEIQRRKEKYKRPMKQSPELVPHTEFKMKRPVLYYEDPFRQAQYMYSLIEGKETS